MDFHALGIVSDSHDDVDSVQIAVRAFRRYGVDHIVHCGDVTTPETALYFSGFKTTFVIGNNDNRDEIAEAAAEIGAVALEQPVCLDWHGKNIFLVHGHEDGMLLAENAFSSGDWDLVCFGHTHYAELRQSEKTILLNPGSLANGDFCILNSAGVVKQFNVQNYE
ncbi:MAG: YfcE family phosphodiesterase [Thermoguttaceae bacterium]|nr:YfcE family phosphodiesterase [Thermoguttaceae bacterium]